MNYRPKIIIINTAVINENSEQLYFLHRKKKKKHAKYVSSHVFHYTSHKKNIKGNKLRQLYTVISIC